MVRLQACGYKPPSGMTKTAASYSQMYVFLQEGPK